jgi:hypothetical protein
MYIIDRDYGDYETNLSKQDGFGNFANELATIGLTSAAALIPLGQTTKILSQTVLAVTAARTAFDKEILLTNSIQALQSQMRTDRANQAKVLISRMTCEINQYPFFLAMSDLEVYRRAGTFESAMGNMKKAIAAAEVAATAAKNNPSTKDQKAMQTALDTLQKAINQPSHCPISK